MNECIFMTQSLSALPELNFTVGMRCDEDRQGAGWGGGGACMSERSAVYETNFENV